MEEGECEGVCVSSVGSAVGEKGELVLTQLTKEKWGGPQSITATPGEARSVPGGWAVEYYFATCLVWSRTIHNQPTLAPIG